MKINLVLPHQLSFPPRQGGGVEKLNYMLASEFARRGHEVVAYSRSCPGVPRQTITPDGIRHVRVKGHDRHPNLWRDHLNAGFYSIALVSAIESADVTSFHTPFSFLLHGLKRSHVCTHTIHRTPKWPVPLYRKLDRVYCGSDAVVSQALAIDPGLRNLKRVHNCIALPADCPRWDDSKLQGSGLHFLYVGRFVRDKGLESLVRGFQMSLGQYPENRLSTVGPQYDEEGADSQFFRNTKEYVQAQGLTSRVELLRPIFDETELGRKVGDADVICVPSLSGETFSMAVLEAMALGKPVLVSDFGPMTEAVEPDVTGCVARAGDAESIAKCMGFFSSNRSRLPEMGRRGFEKARDQFSVEKIAGEYLEDFQDLVDRARIGKNRPPHH